MTWNYFNNIDPLDYDSFVYMIRNTITGEYYIGKKGFWSRKAKKIHKESDWANYWGTSKIMDAQFALHGKSAFERSILHFCVSAGEASWYELVELIKRDAMTDPLCLNGNVLMTFNHKVIKGYQDPDRRAKYLNDIKKQKLTAGISTE